MKLERAMDDITPRYRHVFRELRVGPVTLRNRIFVPAHTTNFGDENLPSDRHLAYHRERARGGVGLIIFEGIRVHRSSLGRRQGVNGYEPAVIPRLAAIADAVRAEGTALFGQIIHLGRHIDGNYTRTPAWSASAVPWTMTAPPPHPMSEYEIAEVVAAHVAVVRNLAEAGLDGVELTMAHGHLLQQFLSPAVNRRTDRYGGSVENRMRFARETLEAVQAEVGGRMAVGLRISADEFLAGGLTLADMQAITVELCSSARVDFVNVSHSAYHGSATISTQMADMAFAADTFHHLPRGVADRLHEEKFDIPVFAACRFRDVDEAEAMLADGRIAMVGMARAHIADAALVRKAQEGREAETRPCISCNQGCAGFLAQSLSITCLTNPTAGREAEWPTPPLVLPPAERRRVLVVGGGPAGMEAAAIAAQRGHQVTLWERTPRLGGAVLWNEHMPLRRDFLRLLDAQLAALGRAGVTVETGHNADAGMVLDAGAEVVLLATGARAVPAPLPSGGDAWTMQQALAADDLGQHVAVQDNLGSWALAGFVEWLAGTGRRVTLITPAGAPGWQLNIYSSYAWRQRLRDKRVRILALHTVEAFAARVLRMTDLSTGVTTTLEDVDNFVSPTHAIPEATIATMLPALAARRGLTGPRILSAGDCVAARSALEAVFEGHQAGRAA